MNTNKHGFSRVDAWFVVFIRVHLCLSVVRNFLDFRDQNSLPVRVVLPHRFHNPLFGLENGPDGVRLAVTQFQHDFSARFQEWLRLRRQLPVENQAVRAAVQRRARIEIADFGLERGDFRRRDIGRVADD